MIINAGIIQDLFHHALAMKGLENGMDAYLLVDRLACGERAAELVFSIDNGDDESVDAWRPRPRCWRTEADMVQAAEILQAAVVLIAKAQGVDPFTGAKVQPATISPAS